MSINVVVLMGRLTADPELRRTTTDKDVTTFSLAVDRYDKTADFFRCVAWDKTAVFVHSYFAKGDMLALRGRLQTRSWEKDGRKQTVTEVVADALSFCGGKKESDKESDIPREAKFTEIEADDSELPF